jgi:hypothetical protein
LIPCVGGHRQSRIGAGEGFNAIGNAGLAKALLPVAGLAGQQAGIVKRQLGFVPLPVRPGPFIPAARAVIEAQPLVMATRKGLGDCVLAYIAVALRAAEVFEHPVEHVIIVIE